MGFIAWLRQSLAGLSGLLLRRRIDAGVQPATQTGDGTEAISAGTSAGSCQEEGAGVEGKGELPLVTVVIHGGRGSGKSTLAEAIAQALESVGQEVRYHGSSPEQQECFWENVSIAREAGLDPFTTSTFCQRHQFKIIESLEFE